jgi:hypothetical protein
MARSRGLGDVYKRQPQYTAWKFAHTQRNFYGDFSAFLRANGGQ